MRVCAAEFVLGNCDCDVQRACRWCRELDELVEVLIEEMLEPEKHKLLRPKD